jgi:DNA polymerase III sliding clamp (beta) subunit (PCNA family)
MLHALKFVQGAIAKKDFTPALTHFRIHGGFVKGFNGSLGLCAPISVDLDIAPKALPFVKAINACTETIALNIADNGKLCVRSGSFKAFIECVAPDSYPDIQPTGKFINLPDSLLPALRYLEPFIAVDASRPWACGVLFDGESAYATNNIVLVQYWLGFNFPSRVNIPAFAVRELIRIGEAPIRLQLSENRLVFHYENGAWLSTQLFEAQWPDAASILDKHMDAPPEEVEPAFWDSLDQLLPFVDEIGRCYFFGNRVATMANPEASGVSVSVNCPPAGVFNARQLANLRTIAKQIAFSAYPAPVPFFGDASRGIIVGIKS